MPKNSTVEYRETRTNSIIGYGGKITDLTNKLRNNCLKNAERSFSQTYQCQQITSILTLISIKDAALVIHAPVGCSGCAASLNNLYKVGQLQRGVKIPENARVINTNFDEKDVVYGGEAKLREAILTIEDRYKPKIIFVLTSCASGIIGDDVDKVIDDTQKDVSSTLILIHCEGFTSKVSSTGYDTCYNAILEYFIEPSNKKEENLINVLSTVTFNYKDQNEIKRLLNELCLEANFIPSFASAEDLKRITAARLNASICQVHGDYLLKVLDEKYNIPHTNTLMPIGIEGTDRWILEIGDLIGKEEEAKKLIAAEHERLEPILQEIRNELKGIKAFVSAGASRAISASELAAELGFEVIGIHTFHLDNILQDSVERLSEGGDIVFDIANMQPFEQANLINKLKPDVFISIGTNVLWAGKQGIPAVDIIEDQNNTLGYSGAIYIGKKILDALKNRGFHEKLSKHTKLPYKKEWLEENPFKYLKSTEEK